MQVSHVEKNNEDKSSTVPNSQSIRSRGVDTLRCAHKWAQNEINLRLKVISFAIMTPSEPFYVS